MILLTGGAGFIGSNILKALNEMGETDILVSDNLTNASKHLNLNNRRFADYIDKEALPAKLKDFNFSLVIHQGACSSTTESNGKYMMENNYEYSKKLFHYCIEKKIPFIYASSAATYGDGKTGFDDSHENYFPLNVYGYSKLLFDRYVKMTIEKHNPSIPVTGLRYFNVYGYQENHKADMASVVYKMFRQVSAGQPVTLFEGSEKIFRDFIFIEDVVEVVKHFIQKNKGQGVYNCGTGKARSFQDMADIFLKLHEGARLEYVTFPAHLQEKYQYFTQAETTRLLETGYNKPFHSLEEGIAKYYQQLKASNGYLP
jgi:ADP-L-glycero-D-manno-heptose 6-epimerase